MSTLTEKAGYTSYPTQLYDNPLIAQSEYNIKQKKSHANFFARLEGQTKKKKTKLQLFCTETTDIVFSKYWMILYNFIKIWGEVVGQEIIHLRISHIL